MIGLGFLEAVPQKADFGARRSRRRKQGRYLRQAEPGLVAGARRRHARPLRLEGRCADDHPAGRRSVRRRYRPLDQVDPVRLWRLHREGEGLSRCAERQLPRYQNVEVGDDLFKMVSPSTHGTSRCPRAARMSDLNNGCGLAPTHQQANFLLTSGEGWLATADSSGGMECPASSFQWDNDAILVRLKPRFCQFRAGF
jgi:hypothetical protein